MIIDCPECGKRLKAPESLAGRSVVCPGCKASVAVPAEASTGTERPAPTNWLPLGLSGLAMFIALASLGLAIVRDPWGSGLDAYDLSTPEAAYRSSLQMARDGNIQALIEIEQLKHGTTTREKLKSLTVHRSSSYQGKKVLFISYTENGIDKHDTAAVEKDADTGLWTPTYVSTYGMTDPALKKAIEDWKKAAGQKGASGDR